MNLKHTANGLNILAGTADAEAGAGGLLVAESETEQQSAEPEEVDDDVEALIVSMDSTTAEHLFLHAQRRI